MWESRDFCLGSEPIGELLVRELDKRELLVDWLKLHFYWYKLPGTGVTFPHFLHAGQINKAGTQSM